MRLLQPAGYRRNVSVVVHPRLGETPICSKRPARGQMRIYLDEGYHWLGYVGTASRHGVLVVRPR